MSYIWSMRRKKSVVIVSVEAMRVAQLGKKALLLSEARSEGLCNRTSSVERAIRRAR